MLSRCPFEKPAHAVLGPFVEQVDSQRYLNRPTIRIAFESAAKCDLVSDNFYVSCQQSFTTSIDVLMELKALLVQAYRSHVMCPFSRGLSTHCTLIR